jgi:hypothetical protein
MSKFLNGLKAASILICLLITADTFGDVRDRYDVVIAGAGTGGFGAAVQAARMGASVLLLDETDYIGGQMNAAAVTSMDEGPVLVRERGIYHEFVERAEAYYGALGKSAETAYWRGHICTEPRVGQKILYEMLNDARAKGCAALDVSLRSTVSKVVKEGDAVSGVVVDTFGQAPRTIACKVLVDATEWGDVIPLTGARYRVGNCTSDAIDPSRHIQMLTWTAVIKQYPGGVPAELQIKEPPPGYTDKVHQYFSRTLVDGDKRADTQSRPWNWFTFVGYRGMPDSGARPADEHSRAITRTHMNFNNDFETRIADVEDPAKRLATCRDAQLKTLQLLYYVQHTLGKTDWSVADDEGYATPYNQQRVDEWLKQRPDLAPYRPILIQFPVMPYVRESRRIIGLHTLTATEIRRNPGPPTLFPTAVALADYPVDLHGATSPDLLERDLDPASEVPKKFGEWGSGPFPVPFECFIPEKVDGFLAAEKNISQSRLANGATRLQPSTMLMGQAVGTIAALAVKQNVRPREVDPMRVQAVLLDAGDTLYAVPMTDVAKEGWEWKPVQLATVHGALPPEKGKFNPDRPLSGTELDGILKTLFDAKPLGTSGDVTRAAFVEAIGRASGVKLAAAGDGPVTRLDAARVVAQILEHRGEKEFALKWPEPKSGTAVSTVDPRMKADLRKLAAAKLIGPDSVDYWLEHAREGEQCDGARVAEVLARAAQALRPGAEATDAVETLTGMGVLGQAEYWKQHAVAGGQCVGKNVAIVLRRIAQQIEVP